MSRLVSLDQITQLRELERARAKRDGIGYEEEFQAFLGRLKSGGVGTPDPARARKRSRGTKFPPRDPRIIQQAKRLWDKGWGDASWWVDPRGDTRGAKSFSEYLDSIPDIPQFPAAWDARFPHLVLVDRRAIIVETCWMLNVDFNGDSETLVPYDPATAPTSSVYWMRAQHGKSNWCREPNDCRTEFASRGDELGLDALEGLALYAQFPDLLKIDTAMDLPSSVRAGDRDCFAYLGRWANGGVGLSWYLGSRANSGFGSASRGAHVS
ncbi:hypothetical protein HY480_04435 [Candidatus Uhrbacteria bacterium]|nr:hypothetical protein [Candidatus Uhrbacteria bacterium]